MDLVAALQSPPPVLDEVLPGLLAGTVGGLVAPGGVGKTQLLLQLAVSRATGLAPIGGLFPAREPEPVLMLVAEEQESVMRRRLHVVVNGLVGEGLFPARYRDDLVDQLSHHLRLYALSGEEVRLVRDGNTSSVLEHVAELASDCRLVIIDPLRRYHDGDENCSFAMTLLVQGLERIANETGSAVLAAHHTNKSAAFNGQGGWQQAARGSSALTDGMRWQANLTAMTPDLGKSLGIEAEDVARYVQFEVAKINYGPKPLPVWLRRGDGGLLTKSDLPLPRKKLSRASRPVNDDCFD